MLTATYIINRLPSRAIDNGTPYEILFGKIPNNDHLRVFGCLAYAHDNKKSGDKFGERGRKCIFVGYPNCQKGYRLYDLESKKIYTSRDVKFFEEHFPYKQSANGIRNTAIFEKGEFIENEQQTSLVELNDAKEMTINSEGENMHENVIENEPQIVEQSKEVDKSTGTTLNHLGKRIRQQSIRLKDFQVDLPKSIDHSQPTTTHGSSTVHPLSNFISYEKIYHAHKAFLVAITSRDEPKYFS